MKPGNSRQTPMEADGNVPIPAGLILEDERGQYIYVPLLVRRGFYYAIYQPD